jgi:hypothetical protein
VTITDEAAGMGIIVVDPNAPECKQDLATVMAIKRTPSLSQVSS